MINSNAFETTEITLLRHGKCEGGQIFRGSTDVPLSEEGFQQMRDACVDGQWDYIVSSPLTRCRVFAEELAQQQGIPLDVDDELREMSFGEWEGQEIERVWKEHKACMLAWSQDPSQHTPPNGEPLVDVALRINHVFTRITEKYRGKRVLIVSHGGCTRVFISLVLNMPLSYISRIDVPYAGMSQLAIYHSDDGDFTKLLRLN